MKSKSACSGKPCKVRVSEFPESMTLKLIGEIKKRMIKDYIKTYYLDKDYPCAESLLRAAAKAYNLKLDEVTYRTLGPFGGGLSVEHICGAITGGVAFIGAILYKGDKESLDNSKETTVKFYNVMVKYFASEMCFDIKKKWRKEKPVPGVKKSYGCLDVVKIASELLDDILDKYIV